MSWSATNRNRNRWSGSNNHRESHYEANKTRSTSSLWSFPTLHWPGCQLQSCRSCYIKHVQQESTKAMIFIDASNTFNNLYRQATLLRGGFRISVRGGSICSNARRACTEKSKPRPLCWNHAHFHAYLPVVRVSYNSYRSVDLKSCQGEWKHL